MYNLIRRFSGLLIFTFALLVPTTSIFACQVQVIYYVYAVDNDTGEFIGGHWQMGWEDVPCDAGGGSTGGGGSNGGGGLPPDPPYLSINEVSDSNPGQPLLHITENSAVVETTVSYDGDTTSTTGNTNVLMLQPLAALKPDTTITVQARNSSNAYATAIFHVTRSLRGPFTGSTSVLAVWTKLHPQREPEQIHSEWTRNVHMLATQTGYDIPTFDARNGEWEHNMVEDQIAGVSAETPNPAWDTRYYIDNPQLHNVFAGWQCGIAPIASAPFLYGTICTEANEFARAGSPAGRAVIVNFDIAWPIGTWLAAGDTVVVSP